MKIKIQKYEMIIVAMIILMLLINYTYIVFFTQITSSQTAANRGQIFLYLSTPLIIVFGCYLWINALIAWFNKFSDEQGVKITKRLISLFLLIIQILGIAYLLGPICNFITYYTNPEKLDVVQYSILFRHPQPFQNTFGGIGAGLIYTCSYFLYAFLRERLALYFSATRVKRQFNVLVLNRTFLAFLISLIIPVLLSLFRIVTDSSFFNGYISLVPPAVLLFYVNLYWVFPRLSKEANLFSISNLSFYLIITAVLVLAFSFFLGSLWSFPAIILLWLIQLLVTTPLTWLYYRQRKEQIEFLNTAEAEIEKSELDLTKSNADLLFLRSQINPHFLFNTLNTLYGSALLEKASFTADGIQKLGDMMRFMLHENNQDFIPVEKEIAYLHNYIDLQRLRIQSSDDVSINENFDSEACNHRIAPMLLLPLVENAFKHGIEPGRHSWIDIDLACSPTQLSFKVTNSRFEQMDHGAETGKSGIGLTNVRKRLEIMHKDYKFDHIAREHDFVAELIINF